MLVGAWVGVPAADDVTELAPGVAGPLCKVIGVLSMLSLVSSLLLLVLVLLYGDMPPPVGK